MDRKAVARQTLEILKRGSYEQGGRTVELAAVHKRSVEGSRLFTPEEGERILRSFEGRQVQQIPTWGYKNCSTVDAVLEFARRGDRHIGVLNFASAKNPGGGFLNGAMAQEESLAATSGLYETLVANERYYQVNRGCQTMMYTDHAIYSPDVVFFRDGRFELQVVLKGEDVREAEQVMRHRMKLALALFANQGDRNLILGAYGCGVFRNDPVRIAGWWKEFLSGGFGGCFDQVLFAVLDRSAGQACIRAFEAVF